MTNAELIQKIRTEIERLKDENNNIRCDHNKAYCQGYGDAFVDLLPFLDTLESENTMSQEELELNSLAYLEQLGYTCIPEGAHTEKSLNSEVLEKEIESYWKENGPMSHAEYDRLAKCARHFYEIGCRRTAEKYDEIEYERQRAEESVSNDLEDAAVDIADALLSKPKDYVLSAKADYWNGAHDGIIAGAEWQREQMISALKNDGDLPIEFIDKFHEIDRTAFQNGQANMKEQMMKEAVEGFIFQSADYYPKQLIAGYDGELGMGDKVRVIVMKKED